MDINQRRRVVRDGLNPAPYEHCESGIGTAAEHLAAAAVALAGLSLEAATAELVGASNAVFSAVWHLVQVRRSRGDSWADIAEDLRVSRQAAQQRYGPQSADHRQVPDSLPLFP
jgi:hypothetical protein